MHERYNELSYFTKIYEAARSQDLPALQALLTKVTLYVKDQDPTHPNPVAKLAAEGEHDAIAFLKTHFKLDDKALIAGYARADNDDAIKEIIDEYDEESKLALLNEAITVYTACKSRHLRPAIKLAQKLIGNSEEKQAAFKAAKYIGFAKDNFVKVFENLDDPKLIKLVAFYLAVNGNDYVVNLINKLEQNDDRYVASIQIACGLARGNHLTKLNDFTEAQSGIKSRLIRAQIKGFAEVHNVDQVNSLLIDASFVSFKCAIKGYISGGYIDEAQQIVDLALEKWRNQSREIYRIWVDACAKENQIDAALNFIEFISDAGSSLDALKRLVIKLVEKNQLAGLKILYEKAEHRQLVLKEMIFSYAKTGVAEMIDYCLKLAETEEERSFMIQYMLHGFAATNNLEKIKLYLATLRIQTEVMETLKKAVNAYIAYQIKDLKIVFKLARSKQEYVVIGKLIFERLVMRKNPDESYDFLLNFNNEPMPSAEDNEILYHCLRLFVRTNKIINIKKLLNSPFHPLFWNIGILKPISDELVKLRLFNKALDLHGSIKNGLANEFCRNQVRDLSKNGYWEAMVAYFYRVSDLSEMDRLVGLIDKSFYASNIFANAENALHFLSGIYSLMVRTALVNPLHSKTAFNIQKVLLRANKLNCLTVEGYVADINQGIQFQNLTADMQQLLLSFHLYENKGLNAKTFLLIVSFLPAKVVITPDLANRSILKFFKQRILIAQTQPKTVKPNYTFFNVCDNKEQKIEPTIELRKPKKVTFAQS
jgi:hypothetical protein